ncbi:hypothetical protein [Leptospira stimsonii]|uniref:SRPBCC family protein n=1 Tax=Leptospira stimsonii TaxID=2202203 RepID=A0A396ZDP6_9LEPT|nr:hypothetical protein [Leptospira stimsonii]RHX92373.1 hypothetical protein DLM75_04040 [Leptospira stimsonii]
MRTIPYLKNTVILQYIINTPFKVDKVFDFFIDDNFSKYYSKIAKGHDYFFLRAGKRIEVGSIIDCEESAGNQSIRHEYHVSDIIRNERIAYFSKPSYMKIKLPWKVIDTISNTYVYYDFESIHSESSNIRLTIGIQFSSKYEKIFSVFFGGMIPWKNHCKEEMEGLKRVLVDTL